MMTTVFLNKYSHLKNMIPLGWLAIYNKYDFAIFNWKPFNFLISFIQFMLHLVDSNKRVFFSASNITRKMFL